MTRAERRGDLRLFPGELETPGADRAQEKVTRAVRDHWYEEQRELHAALDVVHRNEVVAVRTCRPIRGTQVLDPCLAPTEDDHPTSSPKCIMLGPGESSRRTTEPGGHEGA
jgi:hypothetical protein